MKRIGLLIIIFGLSFNSFSQPTFPDPGIAFNDEVLARINITIDPDTLQWIYENVESNIEWHATFEFHSPLTDDTIQDIGFRLRGNTSRYSQKKSFKISFNTFEPGRKWYGLEKMNLNGEHNDPSICRSKLSWDLLREMNVPAPRSNHVLLYINNEFYGVYINVEHIDEEFVESRFGNKNGNLYKCLWPADLAYKGTNPDLYKEEFSGRRAYDLKTNTATDDYTDIAEFISGLNLTTDEEYFCELSELFNINDYLKVIAVDVFIGNWDGYIYNKNNFYLYHNTVSGKFEYIPYDLDNTFGIDWLDRDWATRNIYDWQQHGNNERPLYTRTMGNQDLKDKYSYYINHLNQNIITESEYFARIDALRDMLYPWVQIDPYYPQDYGYTPQDFLNSFEQEIGGHVDYGVKPYVQSRKQSISEQIESNNISPVIKYIQHNSPWENENLMVSAFVEDDDENPLVKLQYQINGGITETAFMYDDGEHGDGTEGDHIYGGSILQLAQGNSYQFWVKAEDETGNSFEYPCEPLTYTIQTSEDPQLFINEFMASNTMTIADEYGEFDDWLEIYNAESEAVYLGNKFLSDNFDNPGKWQLPDIWLEAGEFLLIWTDNDNEQGDFHTNFKLAAGGEEIGIFDSESTGFFPLDSLSFSEQTTDISFGRETDGGNNWVFFETATPGNSNVAGSINTNFETNIFLVFPNPAIEKKVFVNQRSTYTIFDLRGKLQMSAIAEKVLDIGNLESGIYLISNEEGITQKLIIK